MLILKMEDCYKECTESKDACFILRNNVFQTFLFDEYKFVIDSPNKLRYICFIITEVITS